MKRPTIVRILKRADGRAAKSGYSSQDGKRHDRVKRQEKKDMETLFALYQAQGLDTQEAIARIAKGLGRDPETVKCHLQEAAQPEKQAPSKPEVGQAHSPAQLAHFADVKTYIRTLAGADRLFLRPFSQLIYGAREGPLWYSVEQQSFFPCLKVHLTDPVVRPDFWGKWERLAYLVHQVRVLWQEMLGEAEERTGLPVDAEGRDHITHDYAFVILLEEVGELPGCADYRQRSTHVQKSKMVTVEMWGEVSATGYPERSEDWAALMFADYTVAKVKAAEPLPRLQKVHEGLRKDYGPKIQELRATIDNKGQEIARELREQLDKAAMYAVFPGHCPFCPP